MDRPRHIDLGPNESRAASSAGSSRLGLPSPRIQHFDGDIPPTLSPLDAFAAHSRKLAKELEETRLAGQRRMSRLPPQIVTDSLTQHQASRPAIFRSLSSNSQETLPQIPQIETDTAGNSPDVILPKLRPISTYPRISAVLGSENQPRSQTSTPIHFSGSDRIHGNSRSQEYFGNVRAESPESLEHDYRHNTHYRNDLDAGNELADSFAALAPPNAAFARNKGYHESSDDDYTSSNAGSFFSQTRKLSSSSNVSLPIVASAVHNRSPSNNSSSSLPGHRKTPSHLNFSRPRSAASSHAKMDSPTRSQPRLTRKTSQTSTSTRAQTSFDDVRSITSDGVLSQGPSSYTHTRFNLPRGRHPEPPSDAFSSPVTPQTEWQSPILPMSPMLNSSHDAFHQAVQTPTEDLDQEEILNKTSVDGFSFEFKGDNTMLSEQTRRPSSSHTQSGSIKSNSSLGGRAFTSHGAQKVPTLPPIPGSTYASTIDGQSRSSRSNSTVRPTTSRSVSNYQNLSADDHVTKAIDLHQHGDLKESTYHLRIAAKQNHATGMLLYALACRHGWGMRSNPKEGVAWLKKAVDLAMSEVAEDENDQSDKPKSDFYQKKEHRAQFALSIYELGVSHLNGWGVEQDKALALRCFEIAGGWGDPDALSEAGYCYSEGIGCKKDLKKAARFYRMAAKKGVSMVGNSWIYKDKYNEPEGDDKEPQDRGRDASTPKKSSSSAGRSKSKTRSIFGRKKSTAATN